MSRQGACIAAADSGALRYKQLAAINAKLIRKHLGIPVCLITPDCDDHPDFDQVIKVTATEPSPRTMLKGQDFISYDWKNDYRISAIEHSPYERTLLIDADYLVLTNSLRPLLECSAEFLMIDKVHDVTGRNTYHRMRYLPDKSLLQRWATLMVFDKTAGAVFSMAKMVRDNYDYYSAMFGFSTQPFRNDFAFTIAAHVMQIPMLDYTMHQLPADSTVQADERGLMIEYPGHVIRHNHDLHVINKDIVLDPSRLEALLHG